MKVKARLYKGIEFITIGDLPAEQQLLLENSLPEPERIKILIDGKILENCIQYHKYMDWYGTIYATSVNKQELPAGQKISGIHVQSA